MIKGRSQNSSKGRQQNNNSPKQNESKGLISELPMLSWSGRTSNYPDFRESIKTYLIQRFGNNGSFIETNGYYEPPEPTEPTNDPSPKAAIQDRIQWSMYEDELKSRGKLMRRHLEERAMMYEIIWGQIGTESKQMIENHAKFKDAKADADGRKDPLQLWKIIVATHLIKSSGNDALDRAEAKSYYDRIHQRFEENLGDYKLRFDRSIEALEKLQYSSIPSSDEQVIHFIRSLHDSKHYEWKTKMMNDIKAGSTIPATVETAYELCYNYKQLYSETSHNNNNRATTFMTREGKHQNNGQRNAKKGKSSSKESKDQDDDEDASQTDTRNKCYRCGSTEHFANKCTFKGACNKCGKQGHKASLCKSRTTAMTKRVLISDSNYGVHEDNTFFMKTTSRMRMFSKQPSY